MRGFQGEETESGYQKPDQGMRKTPSSSRSRKSGSIQVVEFLIGDERFPLISLTPGR
ncbi:MAG TPA: hypothetical protein VN372_07120 [Methanospirillum sp.]|nr:hypothetical protein [Methanospirillum sp.]